MMGFFKFSAVLNREITEEEFAILQEAGCAGGTLSTFVLPVNDNTVVTQIDFDKAEAETLYDAMQRVLDALTKVPKLSAFSLDVPEPSVGQVPAAAENTQAEPERIPGDSPQVTAEIETAAEPADAAVDPEPANQNGAANGTASTGDDEAAATEPTFAASQLV